MAFQAVVDLEVDALEQCMVMSVGLLITTPSTPFSLCSQTYTTVPPKTGSCMDGIAIRK
jgi:hypothetical protein